MCPPLLETRKTYLNILKKGGKNLGNDFKEIKDNARIEYEEVKNKICNGLSALYDDDVNRYKYFVLFLFKSHSEFLTLNIK